MLADFLKCLHVSNILHAQTCTRNIRNKSNKPRENICNIFIRALISKEHEKLQHPLK